MREELDVHAKTVARGTHGSTVKIPIHKNQYIKSAVQFFPSKQHNLIVTEFANEGSGSDSSDDEEEDD